jgi:hypothetical protein
VFLRRKKILDKPRKICTFYLGLEKKLKIAMKIQINSKDVLAN